MTVLRGPPKYNPLPFKTVLYLCQMHRFFFETKLFEIKEHHVRGTPKFLLALGALFGWWRRHYCWERRTGTHTVQSPDGNQQGKSWQLAEIYSDTEECHPPLVAEMLNHFCKEFIAWKIWWSGYQQKQGRLSAPRWGCYAQVTWSRWLKGLLGVTVWKWGVFCWQQI